MAADFIAFGEGEDYIGDNGLPATVYFLLSTKPCSGSGSHATTDTLSGTGVGEITGTGYARDSQARPAGSSGVRAFSAMTWSTGAAADWPAGVKSVVAVTTPNNTGKALCAWNLQPGGAARDLSSPGTTETFTPTLTMGS